MWATPRQEAVVGGSLKYSVVWVWRPDDRAGRLDSRAGHSIGYVVRQSKTPDSTGVVARAEA